MKRIGRILRIVVSAVLFVWLGSMVDWANVRSTIREAEPIWLVAPHVLSLLTVACCVWRWQILLRAGGIRIPGGGAARSLLIGRFASNFLPSTVGGDVVRAALVARRTDRGRWSAVAASVAVDRMTGLLAVLLVLPVVGLLHRDWLAELNLLAALGLACLGIAGLTVFLFSDAGARFIRSFGRRPLLRKFVDRVVSLHEAMLAYRRHPGAVARAIALSLPFYVLNGLQVWMLSFALPGGPIPWTAPVVMFCAVSLLSTLPISFNGFGLQEGGYTLLFVSHGYTENAAVAIAVAIRLLSVAVSAVGGVLFAVSDVGTAGLAPTEKPG